MKGTRYKLSVVQDSNDLKNDQLSANKLTNADLYYMLNSVHNGFDTNYLKDMNRNSSIGSGCI